MTTDNVSMYRLARETLARVEILTTRAREGKDLMPAKEFASYLEWSGVLRMLLDSEQSPDLPFDGRMIKKRNDQLLEIVHDQFKLNSKEVSLSLSQAEMINHRLDLIAGQLSKVLPAQSEPRFAVAI